MTVYEFNVQNYLGQTVSLKTYEGKVLLIINSAIHCGLTPQYEAIEALYQKYKDQGFEVLDFPCNQFGNQSPEADEETAEICQVKFGNSFKPFAKINVNGPDAHPLYKWLKRAKKSWLGEAIKWNFTKFIVDRKGKVVARFGPMDQPEKMIATIESLL
jgi:glutathione peroxidase